MILLSFDWEFKDEMIDKRNLEIVNYLFCAQQRWRCNGRCNYNGHSHCIQLPDSLTLVSSNSRRIVISISISHNTTVTINIIIITVIITTPIVWLTMMMTSLWPTVLASNEQKLISSNSKSNLLSKLPISRGLHDVQYTVCESSSTCLMLMI